MNSLINNLQALGLTQYEAKSYVALLALGSGQGYAVAKQAGIPTAKVYEALKSLCHKGFAVGDGMKRSSYQPVAPADLLAKLKEQYLDNLDDVQPKLEDVAVSIKPLSVQRLTDENEIINCARRIIRGAEQKLLLTVWPKDLSVFSADLKEAAAKVAVHILVNGDAEIPNATVYRHRRVDLVANEIPERRLLAVNDRFQAITAFFGKQGQTEAIWSSSRPLAQVIADHILHDISLNVVSRKFCDNPDVEKELTALRCKLYL